MVEICLVWGGMKEVAQRASVSDGTVTRVNFYSGGVLIGSDTIAPYGFIWGVNSPGTYTITAIAIDNGGLRKTSSAITITVKASSAQLSSPVTDGGGLAASLLSASGYATVSSQADNLLAPSSWTITDLGADKPFSANRTLVVRPGELNLIGRTGILSSVNDAWFINRTPQGLVLSDQWSESGFNEMAVPCDYDGDGQTDLAIYRPSDGNWYLLTSSS